MTLYEELYVLLIHDYDVNVLSYGVPSTVSKDINLGWRQYLALFVSI